MFVAPPGQARNRALAAALRLARFEALGGLFLLVRGEGRLAAQFDALFLGVGLAARGALQNAAALQLRGNARMAKMISAKSEGCRAFGEAE